MQSDKEKEIERVKAQVAHAEAHGQLDTAHHETLRRLLEKQEPKAKKETKES